ncbi:Succinate semialdehyde dehydrogenase [NAD(P)+] Sad [Achromobacter denitrificans]|uniref:aldehyde dehydrogenase family protein n=1 Tax=Achromobacter denitrificans TaxID=32002 RepID=UPI000786D18F|nr:aldehyde dehydrogenase family protein [Achromobacter denitrificans]OLU10044.1 aldehyde dehydrogenase [Achromobacter denitrificans]QKH44167.1 aldehyde dehydrogenase family protein [Achromobacter denitrificans]QKH48693.1 aldehyde dehydrogenase family protein [Achromobacter denitrificans]CAB3669765.1 Succinate semialdehyde dehydrogenase [NAD(P)+] Sad [Achromobacter denitrificans]SUU08170.1 Succinate semialdehyde dehydrogenase [NAD(P)+] Sad [Achromobacter denitrificans]
MTQELITISPIDGREVVRRPYASDAQIAQALADAQAAQPDWQALGVQARGRIVSDAVDRFVAWKDDIARAITVQMGRPLRYTPGEVAGFEARARHMIAIADEALAPIRIPAQAGFTRFICREPIGVALTIAPWNYPLLTAVNSIVPALMAGNTVILKHSDQTPLCAEFIGRAFREAGAPKGVFQYLHASHDIAQRLIRAPEIGYVSFTGSVRGGRAVEEGAAGRFIGVGLELGGNDPAYVRADARLDHAVETLVDGAYFNSGQSCCGIQRIYVARPRYEEFVERAVALTQDYVLGDPLHADTTLGPVVRTRAAEEIRGIVDEAVAAGARNLIDPSRFIKASKGSPYVAPALLTQVDHRMRVMNDECFGPVVGIMPVDSDEEAVALMNDSPYGLTAAAFTQDEEAALRIGRQLRTGTFFMNRCDYLDPALAWTGVKNSGRGVSLSAVGYEPLTQAKSFHLRSV